VARQLLALGFDAAALAGGYQAWRAAYPVEPKGRSSQAREEAHSGDGGSPYTVAPAQERGIARNVEHDRI
jgi:hypothetical protein